MSSSTRAGGAFEHGLDSSVGQVPHRAGDAEARAARAHATR